MGSTDQFSRTSVFVMTNEKDPAIIREVKQTCETKGKFKCYFLGDFTKDLDSKNSSDSVSDSVTTIPGVDIGGGGVYTDTDSKLATKGSSLVTNTISTQSNTNSLLNFLQSDPTGHRLFFTELAVAIQAARFLGYGSSRLVGECSAPSLVVAQMRLYHFDRAPAMWLLQPPVGIFGELWGLEFY